MEKQGVVAIDDVGITPVMALRTRFTPIQWLVCLVAAIGFAFDIDEVVILPLVLRPAFASLRKLSAGTREFNLWAGMFFFIPTAAGGIFGLLGWNRGGLGLHDRPDRQFLGPGARTRSPPRGMR